MLTVQVPGRQAARFPFFYGWRAAAAIGVLLLAAVTRLWHISHGLPDFLEEAIPFKTALAMWGWQTGEPDFNPHFFNYPTLVIYCHLLLQKLMYLAGWIGGTYQTPADLWLRYQHDPTSLVVAGRMLGILADLASVLAVLCIGERLRRGAGLLAGTLVALSPTMISTARLIYVDPVMTALALWAIERLMRYHTDGGRGRLAAAILLIGFAAGAKYNAGLLVIPLAWVLWQRHGRSGLLRWPVAAGISLVCFLITSPYTLLDFPTFWKDFAFEGRHMAAGHLGSLDQAGAGFLISTLARNFGAFACLSLPGVFLFVLIRIRRNPVSPALLLWCFLIPVAVSLAWFRTSAERYLLPMLPMIALLLAATMLEWTATLPSKQFRRLATILLVCVLTVPTAAAGWRVARTGEHSTQQLAREWIEGNVDPGAVVLQEMYGAHLRNSFDIETITDNPSFAAASENVRDRFLSIRTFRSVLVPMAVSGRFLVSFSDAQHRSYELPVFPHPSDFNAVFYMPALLSGVDYFIVSGGVQQRYRADRQRFPAQNLFYEFLTNEANPVERFSSGDGVSGPTLTVYRLDDACQQTIRQKYSSLRPYWWAETVPREFRRAVETIVSPGNPDPEQIRTETGGPAGWVQTLEQPFSRFILPFLLQLAHFQQQAGHHAASRHLASHALAMRPDVIMATVLFSRSSAELGDYSPALAAIENSIRVLQRRNRQTGQLRLEQARVLHAAGQPHEAIQLLDALLEQLSPTSPTAEAVRHLHDEITAALRSTDRNSDR